jgi:putative sugar O-methyltransferase
MKEKKPVESKLWQYINTKHITKKRVQNLKNFKSNDVNFKLSLWNPHTNGVRYLKSLIYNLCMTLTTENWERLSKTKKRDVGNPISITFNDENTCLDYLQAVYELEFIENGLLQNIRSRHAFPQSILEIGAGYGRTCHTIISNHSSIETYFIIDLQNCLSLSKRYLREVLDDSHFSKIHFISVENIVELDDLGSIDLCINIDSFAEMEPRAINYYLDYIDKHGKFFYVKNPVAKYLDPTLSIVKNKKEMKLAISTGVLCEIIDIHNNRAVMGQVHKFIQAYQPGNKWRCIADGWALPWSYYWQAIYEKKNI